MVRRLSRLDASTEQHLSLSRWLVRLGNAEATLGLPEADARYREALEIGEGVAAAEPENREALDLVSSARSRLAQWYLGAGKP